MRYWSITGISVRSIYSVPGRSCANKSKRRGSSLKMHLLSLHVRLLPLIYLLQLRPVLNPCLRQLLFNISSIKPFYCSASKYPILLPSSRNLCSPSCRTFCLTCPKVLSWDSTLHKPHTPSSTDSRWDTSMSVLPSMTCLWVKISWHRPRYKRSWRESKHRFSILYNR